MAELRNLDDRLYSCVRSEILKRSDPRNTFCELTANAAQFVYKGNTPWRGLSRPRLILNLQLHVTKTTTSFTLMCKNTGSPPERGITHAFNLDLKVCMFDSSLSSGGILFQLLIDLGIKLLSVVANL